MYYPPPWHDGGSASLDDSNFGPTVDTSLFSNVREGYWGINYPLPETICDRRRSKCSSIAVTGGPNDWFTNYTFISGQPTLPSNMYDNCKGICYRKVERVKRQGHPWTSPGSAPTFGEGCGANGGNPYGCRDSRVDPRPYGSCCDKVRRTFFLSSYFINIKLSNVLSQFSLYLE